MEIPERTPDTMSDAIALSSPAGKMSKRARREAEKRLFVALFGDGSCLKPQFPKPDRKKHLLRKAKELRELAARGMCTKKYNREAAKMEFEAESLKAKL